MVKESFFGFERSILINYTIYSEYRASFRLYRVDINLLWFSNSIFNLGWLCHDRQLFNPPHSALARSPRPLAPSHLQINSDTIHPSMRDGKLQQPNDV